MILLVIIECFREHKIVKPGVNFEPIEYEGYPSVTFHNLRNRG